MFEEKDYYMRIVHELVRMLIRLVFNKDIDRDGEEVAQVYTEFPEDSWNSHPLRELRAFRKVFVPAHSRAEVRIRITEDLFTYYNPALKKWTVEEGVYRLYAGNSSRNLPLCMEWKVSQEECLTNWQVMK